MAKYVPDATTKRWVVIAPDRMKRVADVCDKPSVTPEHQNEHILHHHLTQREMGKFISSKPTPIRLSTPVTSGTDVSHPHASCPFCPGHELMTPPEVYRVGNGLPETADWSIRVVPNKYPITDIHEVIIHGPSHDMPIEDMDDESIRNILKTYRNRYRTHMEAGAVMIFCNYGDAAGASKLHPHSQVVVVPKQINLDAVSREPVANVVEVAPGFTVYCPDFSQWPLETWITPTDTELSFAEQKSEDLAVLADLLKRTLRRIRSVVAAGGLPFDTSKGFSYNYYIAPGVSWFLRITPRLIHRAGFELGTGLSVNVVDPVDAAELLKKQKIEE
jgi:UDPglucose--hexose-1-phosphate uridylyltransferase